VKGLVLSVIQLGAAGSLLGVIVWHWRKFGEDR
jgi:hypothetical protein